MLDLLKEKQYDVVGIGKISDIFAQQGLTKSFSTKSNSEGMAVLKKLTTQTNIKGLIMANLVEFDSLYGHRNDVEGYAKALELFDKELGSLLPMLKADDLLIITADHGCDPTTASTDHSREYVPLLLYNEHLQCKNLGTRKTFADVAATIATNFNLKKMKYGENLSKTLPIIALGGACLLLICDIVGRLVIYPFEVPIGLTAGVVGGAIFLILILRGLR